MTGLEGLLRYTRATAIVGDILKIRAHDVGLGDMALVEMPDGEQSLAQAIQLETRLDEHGRSMMRRLYARLSSTLASQFREIDALFGSAEMARRFSAFHLADAAAELPTLAFAAAQI